ncbi:hypothetical protein [Bacillus sp. AFS053548]|uniref:hypothetical protein n=1 Tax=Bacillus sp. AFS053548 TaxID=2033505 RepID=UPI000BFCD546|nr:hypothetical protein [Bacillus sp. AFS053548]PGM58804.1 hypothetical protein CN946_04110 [Bacillus sp. AFS053548]
MGNGKVLKRMILWHAIYVILALIGFYPSMATGFYFDGATITMPIYFAYYSYPCFILTFVLLAVISWICFGLGKYKIIRWLNVIPFFWIFWGIFWIVFLELNNK